VGKEGAASNTKEKGTRVKVVILAGGEGTRLSEETVMRPKPMVEIAEKPILWHIMKIFSHYGHNDFVVCCGYKGYVIKEYFQNYFLHQSDVTIDLVNNRVDFLNSRSEPWKVTLVDTGQATKTAGRLSRIRPFVEGEPFLMTYGDGVADVDVNALIEFHKSKKKTVTVTAVQPQGRFGDLQFGTDESIVSSFVEKPTGGTWINGGFFVLEPEAFDHIEGDVAWEVEPLTQLARQGQLAAYRHTGFWKAMDTLRDKRELEKLWAAGAARWKVW
jgi:glucose-1-phosphate cytidylyltransferase